MDMLALVCGSVQRPVLRLRGANGGNWAVQFIKEAEALKEAVDGASFWLHLVRASLSLPATP